jgi:hypothetical protein
LKNGLGAELTDPAEMKKYLDDMKLSIDSSTKAFLESQNTFYIDFEFAGNTALEICVLNNVGETIVDCLVNHSCTIRQLYDRCHAQQNRRVFGTVLRLFGQPSAKMSPGLTPNEIARKLKVAGMNESSVLVEWSTSRCDWHHLQSLMSVTDYVSIMPKKENSFLAVNAWRRALPAFPSFQLSVFFRAVFPTRKDLISRSHRAGADTEMLRLLTSTMRISANVTDINTTVRKRNDIRSYFKM